MESTKTLCVRLSDLYPSNVVMMVDLPVDRLIDRPKDRLEDQPDRDRLIDQMVDQIAPLETFSNQPLEVRQNGIA